MCSIRTVDSRAVSVFHLDSSVNEVVVDIDDMEDDEDCAGESEFIIRTSEVDSGSEDR